MKIKNPLDYLRIKSWLDVVDGVVEGADEETAENLEKEKEVWQKECDDYDKVRNEELRKRSVGK